MTGKEIVARLEEFFGDNVHAYAYGNYTEAETFDYEAHKELDWKEREVECLKQLGLGEIKEVDSYGGEGQGETWYVVNHFVDHDVYIRTDGFYSSYNGTDFDEGFGSEVRPISKTITVFE